jgi:SIS domain
MLDRYADAARHALGADSVAADGMLHLFGAGHSQLLALDAYARTGGLACVNPILDPALSPAAILEGEDLRPGDAAVTLASGDRVGPLTTVVGATANGEHR